ncbi:MAG: hypothetical protein OXI39_04030 [Gemmatimonadota bacterium]|uniref:hypothetical protein n=1 Tax=Candidatus Palauibacter scopulicola TaxID=3056741 RepID=UPI00238A394D|nr:hypothetical protein [Candidatus Palauibacter scopulicola]MDE2662150.1 hypothetical protein [Candidatus Palauibacter scopulicola]
MRPEHPLADVERSLAVPPRRRLDVLEEVDADAEALQAELERRGYGPAQARRAALRRVVPGTETLAQLEAQHAPPLGRWARGTGWIDRVERLGIVVATGLAGAVACITILGTGALGSAAVLAWPQVIVVALLAANWTRAAKRLWIDGDLRRELRRRLWERQIGLIVLAVALGALGAAREVWGAFGALEAEGFAPPAMWDAVGRVVSFAALGLSAAIFGLFGWLAITPRLIDDETMEHRISAFFASRLPPTPSRRR